MRKRATLSVLPWLLVMGTALLTMSVFWQRATAPVWLMILAPALLLIALSLVAGLYGWRYLHQRQRAYLQTEMLQSLVHEFQTPIATIRMAADLLDSPLARGNAERTDKYLRMIREETERMKHQVETMLSLAHADRNELVLHPEPLNMHDLLQSVADRHGEYITLHLEATQPLLMADRLHLTNVLHNLVDNAVKYSNNDPDITLRTATIDKQLAVAISDQGIGIPAHLQERIFRPFYRVEGRDQPSVKGFGLGLSYVQRIVQAHNWQLKLTSTPGQGSEFRILMPVLTSERVPQQKLNE